MNDGVLLVGADMSGLSRGSAHVFTRSEGPPHAKGGKHIVAGPLCNTTWVKAATLHNDGGTAGDFFGASCDLHGTTALVGAYLNGGGSSSNSKGSSYDAIDPHFPGAAYSYSATDGQWLKASASSSLLMHYITPSMLAFSSLALAGIVILVVAVFLYRSVYYNKERDDKRDYLNTVMDSSNANMNHDNGMDISMRSDPAMNPVNSMHSVSLSQSNTSSVEGNSLHLENFRKKKSKVTSLSSSIYGNTSVVTPVRPPQAMSSADPYHSPNLLEEHGLGESRNVSKAIPKPYPTSSQPSQNVFSVPKPVQSSSSSMPVPPPQGSQPFSSGQTLTAAQAFQGSYATPNPSSQNTYLGNQSYPQSQSLPATPLYRGQYPPPGALPVPQPSHSSYAPQYGLSSSNHGANQPGTQHSQTLPVPVPTPTRSGAGPSRQSKTAINYPTPNYSAYNSGSAATTSQSQQQHQQQQEAWNESSGVGGSPERRSSLTKKPKSALDVPDL